MKPKTKTLIFLVLAFLLGGVCGGLVVRQWSRPSHTSRPMPRDMMKEFSERLHLTAQQTTMVDSILEIRRQRMEGYRTYFVAVRDSARSEIRKILTADQLPLFEAYINEMNQRESKFRPQTAERKEK